MVNEISDICEHERVAMLQEHPKEMNSKGMGDRQHYWAYCVRCQTSLLRTFDDYVATKRVYTNQFVIYKKVK